jgi:hypothetical protein
MVDALNDVGIPKTAPIRYARHLKAGRLLVRGVDEKDTVFHFMNVAFDQRSLFDLLGELRGRGIDVESAV